MATSEGSCEDYRGYSMLVTARRTLYSTGKLVFTMQTLF